MTEEKTPEQNYVEDMLLNVADELNVKEIIIEKRDVYANYRYDTTTGNGIGFDNDEWMMASLLFTGDVMRDMETVRDLVRRGPSERSAASIKVRQPLQSITIKLAKKGLV